MHQQQKENGVIVVLRIILGLLHMIDLIRLATMGPGLPLGFYEKLCPKHSDGLSHCFIFQMTFGINHNTLFDLCRKSTVPEKDVGSNI